MLCFPGAACASGFGSRRELQREEIIARLCWEKILSCVASETGRRQVGPGGELRCRMIADKMPGPAPMASGEASAAL